MGTVNPAQDYYFNFGVFFLDNKGQTVEIPESIGTMVAYTHAPATGYEDQRQTVPSKPC